MNKNAFAELDELCKGKIYVAGHRGMVGSAIVRRLYEIGCENLLLRSRKELDLTNQRDTHNFLLEQEPNFVIIAAARVGGIHANSSNPGEFIYENLMMAANIIDSAHKAGVNRLLFLGSSCIYPRLAQQPMTEDCLLTGRLEPTNEPYAIAKIAGIKLCESYNRQFGTDFRSIMPTNLYGPNDNFDLKTSHVLPALIRKFHDAKLTAADYVEIWGTGKPRREFLHVDDLASASVYILTLPASTYSSNTEPMLSHINIGCGEDISIMQLAELIREIVGFKGEIKLNTKHPDGTPQKLLSVKKLEEIGWKASIDLHEGIKQTYEWYKAHAV